MALGQRLILHGRYLCTATKPLCADCPLNELCKSAEAKPWGSLDRRLETEHRILHHQPYGPL